MYKRKIKSILNRLRKDIVGADKDTWNWESENAINSPHREIRLRRYPYPFKCALAISNDTDGMTAEACLELHDFVNGTQPTAMGDGLGLEMGDSFWVWSQGHNSSLFHSAPYDQDTPLSPESEKLAELAKLGWLDTLHGFGDWTSDWTIDRDRILYALDQMDSLGMNPTVYVGHGGYNMAHNIGGPWGYYQKADLLDDRSYCQDLLLDFGFRYYWSDVFYELDKFGEYQIFKEQHELDEAISQHDFSRYFYCNDSVDYSRSREVFPNISKSERIAWKRKLFNRTLVPVELRDGSEIYFFKRFRGHDGPNSGNFVQQVNSQSLDALEKCQGCAIVYQHFGVWRAINMGKRHRSQQSSPSPILDKHGVWAFRELAERNREGRVFVTTTSRLLDYLRVRDTLDYEIVSCESEQVLRIKGIDCPVYGYQRLSKVLAQGIAFELPRNKFQNLRVEVEGISQDFDFQRQADSENPNVDVLFSPWEKLEYPQ